MVSNNKFIGQLICLVGLAILIVSAHPFLFPIVGIIVGIIIINYGLQMQGLPNLFVTISQLYFQNLQR